LWRTCSGAILRRNRKAVKNQRNPHQQKFKRLFADKKKIIHGSFFITHHPDRHWAK
jgi:hypothetical protein